MDQRTALKVLVVDNEVVVRGFLVKFFGLLGFKVSCADDISQALALVQNEKFDFTFVELRLFDSDGLSGIRELKKFNPDARYILTSTQYLEQYSLEAEKTGIYFFAEKPFNLEQLKSIVAA
jgi:DNA-binding NtrC family response regulator